MPQTNPAFDTPTMRRARPVLLLGYGSIQQTTNQLLAALHDDLDRSIGSRLAIHALPQGVMAKILFQIQNLVASYRDISHSSGLVIYASAALSLFHVLWARLLGRRVTILIWDLYPDAKVHEGAAKATSLATRLYALAERFALRRASVIAVPSSDYSGHPYFRGFDNLRQLPLWPTLALQPPRSRTPWQPGSDRPVEIAFAGQNLASRGINEAIEKLRRVFTGPLRLSIFEPGRTVRETRSPSPDVAIDLMPEVPHGDLPKALDGFDFGLVAIQPDYPLPCAPSKTLLYVAARLPILYHGPHNAFMEDFVGGRIGMTITQLESAKELSDRWSAMQDEVEDNFERIYAELLVSEKKIAEIF